MIKVRTCVFERPCVHARGLVRGQWIYGPRHNGWSSKPPVNIGPRLLSHGLQELLQTRHRLPEGRCQNAKRQLRVGGHLSMVTGRMNAPIHYHIIFILKPSNHFTCSHENERVILATGRFQGLWSRPQCWTLVIYSNKHSAAWWGAIFSGWPLTLPEGKREFQTIRWSKVSTRTQNAIRVKLWALKLLCSCFGSYSRWDSSLCRPSQVHSVVYWGNVLRISDELLHWPTSRLQDTHFHVNS